MTKNQYKESKVPKLPFQQTKFNEPANLVSQPVQMVEKRFQKISEPSLESQESNKKNKVQFRIRMTKNQHKQSKLPKLSFQQTETNEPDGSVYQPVQKVEKRFQKNFRTFLTNSGIQKDKRSTILTPNDQEPTQTK